MSYNDDRAAEAAEAASLRAEIISLRANIAHEQVRQQTLIRELNIAIAGLVTENAHAIALTPKVDNKLEVVESDFNEINHEAEDLFYTIGDVSSSYFTYKNLSMATKKLTELNDKMYTKYKFFNYLRKVTIGNIINIDKSIIDNEIVVNKVEDSYLKTTDYWLSYANMSVMHWFNNNREAAQRALNRSFNLNESSSILFYLIVHLRFNRIDTAKKWYSLYLSKIDINQIDNNFKYLLQLFLNGVLGTDKEFVSQAKQHLKDILNKTFQLHPDFADNIKKRTLDYMNLSIANIDKDYANLKRYSKEYNEMINLLSLAKKNELFIYRIRELFESENEFNVNLFERIEEILFSLISEYEQKELETYKEIKYNEMVIRANGDLQKARELYNMEFEDDSKTYTLDKLLVDYAFNKDKRGVDTTVRRFAILVLKKWILEAFSDFAIAYRKTYKDKYVIEIDGFTKECNENDREELIEELKRHYDKNRLSEIIKDKFILSYLAVFIGIIVGFVFMAFAFNMYLFIALCVSALLFAFLIWRRVVKVLDNYIDRKEKGVNTLCLCLDEMSDFRKTYINEDKKNEDLLNIFNELKM